MDVGEKRREEGQERMERPEWYISQPRSNQIADTHPELGARPGVHLPIPQEGINFLTAFFETLVSRTVERINLYCYKSPSFWPLVLAALGNW